MKINLVLKLLSSRISSLPSLAACSRTSNSLTSPASPATEVFNSSWQPAAGQPTLKLHQLFNEDTTAPGLLPLPLDQLISSQIYSLTSLVVCSRNSNSSTSPPSPATQVFHPSCQPSAGPPTLQLHQLLQSLQSKTLAGLPPLGLIRYRVE